MTPHKPPLQAPFKGPLQAPLASPVRALDACGTRAVLRWRVELLTVTPESHCLKYKSAIGGEAGRPDSEVSGNG